MLIKKKLIIIAIIFIIILQTFPWPDRGRQLHTTSTSQQRGRHLLEAAADVSGRGVQLSGTPAFLRQEGLLRNKEQMNSLSIMMHKFFKTQTYTVTTCINMLVTNESKLDRNRIKYLICCVISIWWITSVVRRSWCRLKSKNEEKMFKTILIYKSLVGFLTSV